MTWHKPDEKSQSATTTSSQSSESIQTEDALGDDSPAVEGEEVFNVFE